MANLEVEVGLVDGKVVGAERLEDGASLLVLAD